jgi:hypothetical protein
MKSIFSSYVFSPDLPNDMRINRTVFYILNVTFFILAMSFVFFSTSKGKTTSESYFTPWNTWFLIVLITFALSLLRSFTAPFKLLGLVLYAYNRRLLFSLALNVIVFPIEWIILENSKASLREVTSTSTFFIKVISYSYLYFLLFLIIKNFAKDFMSKNQS